MGCFTCHGPLGKSGIPNPGAPEGEVPAWDGGNHMMYVASPKEIREWILYGAPKRKLDDPFHQKQMAESRVRMPAYEDFLSEEELEDPWAMGCWLSSSFLPLRCEFGSQIFIKKRLTWPCRELYDFVH